MSLKNVVIASLVANHEQYSVIFSALYKSSFRLIRSPKDLAPTFNVEMAWS
jgi:hypothetical protein